MVVKAVIFDMDGVIVDSSATKFEAYKRTFRTMFGIEIQKPDSDGGRPETDVVQGYLREHGLQGDVSEVIMTKRKFYYDLVGQVNLIPGAMNALQTLKAKGYKLGLATNSDKRSLEMLSQRLGFGQYFDIMLTQEDVSRHKPEPDVYLVCAKQLGIAPAECIAVEDSGSGIRAALSAGMGCIAITTTRAREKLSEANQIISSLDELLPAIQKVVA